MSVLSTMVFEKPQEAKNEVRGPNFWHHTKGSKRGWTLMTAKDNGWVNSTLLSIIWGTFCRNMEMTENYQSMKLSTWRRTTSGHSMKCFQKLKRLAIINFSKENRTKKLKYLTMWYYCSTKLSNGCYKMYRSNNKIRLRLSILVSITNCIYIFFSSLVHVLSTSSCRTMTWNFNIFEWKFVVIG